MINKTVGIEECHHPIHPLKRIYWTAIFVGALIGVGLGFLLNLFIIAIGLNIVTINPQGSVALAVGGFIGVLIAIISSMVTAGYAAGYLGRWYCPKRNLGILYGFTTWSLALLLSAIVMAHVSDYVKTYANTIAGSTIIISSAKDNVGDLIVSSQTSSAIDKHSRAIVTSANSLAFGTLFLFALYFIGAISTCIGACWGMICQRED